MPFGTIMHFSLEIDSIGVINHTFSIWAMFKHWISFRFLSIISRMAYDTLGNNLWKVFLEIWVLQNLANQAYWTNIQTRYNDEKINNQLVMQNCCIDSTHCDAYDVITCIKIILSSWFWVSLFNFILKVLFILKIFKFLFWLFSHVGKTAW